MATAIVATALAGLVAAACPSAESGAGVGLSSADSAVADWVESERIPGAVLLVAAHGDVLLERAYGYAHLFAYGNGQYGDASGIRRLETPIPMTTETRFDLASVSKAAGTTLAVMLLHDRGGIDLDAPLSTYLPDFAGEGKDAVTPRRLLAHTAGLRPWVPTYYHASTADAAYAYVRDLPLAWTPGEERHYSDLGFMLLGRMVERVDGRPLDDFLAEELYRPMGLDATGYRRGSTSEGAEDGEGDDFAATSHGNPYERRMVRDPDFGYDIDVDPDRWAGWRDRTLVGEVNDGNSFHAFGGVAGHAGLFSTASDLAGLLGMVAAGGIYDGIRHLRPETVRLFTDSVVEGQALGWQLPGYAPAGSFGHTGFTGTFVLVLPAYEAVVVLLTNRQNVGVDEATRYPDVGPLQRAVAGFVAEALGGPREEEER